MKVPRTLKSRTNRRAMVWVLVRILKGVLDYYGITDIPETDLDNLVNALFPLFDLIMGVLVVHGRINPKVDFSRKENPVEIKKDGI